MRYINKVWIQIRDPDAHRDFLQAPKTHVVIPRAPKIVSTFCMPHYAGREDHFGGLCKDQCLHLVDLCKDDAVCLVFFDITFLFSPGKMRRISR
jgi:hypothetical protein